MKLPEEILDKIERISNSFNSKEITEKFRTISDRYRGQKEGQSLLSQREEAVAYAIARMPATYAAVSQACEHTFEILNLSKEFSWETIKTLIDVGAGTGAASVAIVEELEKNKIQLEKVTCYEREKEMIYLGKNLLAETKAEVLRNSTWIEYDIMKKGEGKEEVIEAADIVVASYMLNELAEEKVLDVVKKLWDRTSQILILVDPGTPKDYERIIKIKDYLVEQGGTIVAPCLSSKGCEIPKGDWCHFTCRVERTKLQKRIKTGEVPYEDEKFTYLAIAKKNDEWQEDMAATSRVIRHPIIRPNMVEIKLCTRKGIQNHIFTKKEKETYKLARKVKVGDIIKSGN